MTKKIDSNVKALNALKKTHAKWEQRLAQGFAVHCEAVAHIIADKTYKALGYSSFEKYCEERLPWGAKHSYYLRQCHLTMASLPANVAQYLSNESQLKPLYGMKTANQVKVIKQVVKLANGKKITAKMIMHVAERLMNWASKQDHAASKQSSEKDTTMADLEAAFTIINARMESGGYDAVQKYGDPFKWRGFADALKRMQDASDASP